MRRALVAVASAAGALALCVPASANPGAPCEEVVFVGSCEPVGGHPAPVVQQPHPEYAVTPDANSAAISIG